MTTVMKNMKYFLFVKQYLHFQTVFGDENELSQLYTENPLIKDNCLIISSLHS